MKHKFIQIATSVQHTEVIITALDESGRVWRFDDDHSTWRALPRHRTEPDLELEVEEEMTT